MTKQIAIRVSALASFEAYVISRTYDRVFSISPNIQGKGFRDYMAIYRLGIAADYTRHSDVPNNLQAPINPAAAH
jgi:hypothetical protein